MGLAIDGNEVHGIARGGQAFVSLGNTNADGSISFNGYTYELKMKTSDSFLCTWRGISGTTPASVGVDPSQSLSSGLPLTLQDLINKKEKIRLTVVFHDNSDYSDSSLDSGIIDLSKPDSNGHFNFQWLKGATSTNTYCSFNSSANKFSTYSDAFRAYTSSNYDPGHMTISYPDES